MKSKNLRCLFVSVFFLVILLSSSDTFSTVHEVFVRNNFFTPPNMNINVGDTVKWTWQQGVHTTSCDGSPMTSRPPGAPSWAAAINNSNTTFKYVVTVAGTYNYRCDFHFNLGMVGSFTANQPVIAVNIKLSYEGFWNGSTNVADTAKVFLHNSSPPYAVVDSAKKNITSSGIVLISFPNAGTGSYYIDVRHRNALETWSQSPVAFTLGSNSNYDFTTAQSQAFGNNMMFKLGRWCFFSGDVNQDGLIDVSDQSEIDNDVINVTTGYVNTDLTGDSITDLSDASIADNNAFDFVSVIKP
ncbi:MAG: hypothetical protein IPM38_00100 [Ignavibacteria bacterium]|nr:hypothetical protein [Ignavibacteria bacterium]